MKLITICHFIFAGLFIVSAESAFSQENAFSSNKISWASVGFSDLLSGEKVDMTCQFITDRGKTMEWIQNGSTSYIMKISNAQIDWSDMSNDGKVTFEVVLQEYKGIVEIRREASQISLTIDLSRDSEQFNRIKSQYVITNFQIL